MLDLQAGTEQLQVAARARDLAAQQLTQARDRFAAGVTSNIEVVQAQKAVALANEQYIAALYGHNLAKGAGRAAARHRGRGRAPDFSEASLMADQAAPSRSPARRRFAVVVGLVVVLAARRRRLVLADRADASRPTMRRSTRT